MQAYPALRLVGMLDADDAAMRTARDEVVRANRSASQLPPMDAAMIFSRRVRDSLEGGAAAILTPERRRRLVDLAQRLGMTSFDASLTIAVVQDRARRGEPLDQPALVARLDTLHTRMHRRRFTAALIIVSSVSLAFAMLSLMIRWVTAE
jgi:hypothetical protein